MCGPLIVNPKSPAREKTRKSLFGIAKHKHSSITTYKKIQKSWKTVVGGVPDSIQCPQQSYLHLRPSFSPPLALLPLVLESVVFPHPPDVGGGEGAERAPQQPRLGRVVLEEVRAQALDRLERAVRASLEVAAPVAAKGEKSRNNCVFFSKSLFIYLLCFRSWLFFLDLLLKDSGQTEQA